MLTMPVLHMTISFVLPRLRKGTQGGALSASPAYRLLNLFPPRAQSSPHRYKCSVHTFLHPRLRGYGESGVALAPHEFGRISVMAVGNQSF
jgi:hypothetical protein